ncbi:hypothetical protein Cst_c17320 [Thermoclostridium stercorarium subsp. stercorarium DSM 8532]|jgi:hypothetical protein|uniref:Uncharacterized protein n=3 Tax=Thermoclostridium stercorarium TaxID=1510 RepID=L7VPK5_THES1|nr:hypothetical protein [Thermoclostridium stercorarium]AGC68712.1 hypothetical protein Cst_c17320 [Thermoclostridium stercorarium subsp. stercorarium DSM 8532]AGI39721.1 hypothetical protein Clst_1667 [Thermoclostridium stercorarium subsp. stercorarium DSM 8532]ANW99045.1 hypothetical protein CSTERTH_08395 [Thermoclostridium stercorarium subsp. thermolacticum DSM 2910]ANX01573.1 hypothetical protein CSTERLE_08295 [Thermoclostridium stercorarium subsp. leptospartum DSM 9219]
MKKEDLKTAFGQIRPDEAAKKRMLDNILKQRGKEGMYMPFNFRKTIPAMATVVVIVAGLLTYNLSGNHGKNLFRDHRGTDYSDTGREDAVAPIVNQFCLSDRHYILLSDDLREEFGLPSVINENDLGDKIGIIETSPDLSLLGGEVYHYIPAGCEAVVAVKKGNEYQLFRFFVFDSYNNNQDEDSAEYLKLFGIYKADDISKIQFIRHSEQSKQNGYTDIIAEMTDRDEIELFYNYYSVLKNSSNRYFEILFNYNNTGNSGIESDYTVPETDIPDKTGSQTGIRPGTAPDDTTTAEDLPLTGNGDTGGISADTPLSSSAFSGTAAAGSGTVQPLRGYSDDALANPVTIRIYNKNGLYYDSPYYRNIGFISRYEINNDFREFLDGYVK